MEQKINIAEILRDCPQGMELDCVMYENLYFDYISNNKIYPICCYTEDNLKAKHPITFTWYGRPSQHDSAKCVIFPKNRTTWEEFVPPCKFKDGDVIFTQTDAYDWGSIFKQFSGNSCCTHIDLCINDNALIIDSRCLCDIGEINTQRLATEEEKQKLFQAIKDNGYRWDPETKTLEKLVESKFHEGNWVVFNNQPEKGSVYQVKDAHNYEYTLQHILGGSIPMPFSRVDMLRLWTIDDAKDGDVLACNEEILLFKSYSVQGFISLYCWYNGRTNNFHSKEVNDTSLTTRNKIYPATKEQRDFLFQKIKEAGYKWVAETKTLEKLVTNKFDITTLVPFESKVLIRRDMDGFWKPAVFGFYCEQYKNSYVLGGTVWTQCIPYEGNEHLLGTKGDCNDYYKTWE